MGVLRKIWSYQKCNMPANTRLLSIEGGVRNHRKHRRERQNGCYAQLLIRKLGSFIRLRRDLLLRSDIRLATSGIRYASLGGE